MTRIPRPGWLALCLAMMAGLQPLAAGAQGSPSPGWLWRSHSAGRAALARGTNATLLKRVDQLPATAALRTQLAAGLARAPREFWQKDLAAGLPDAAELWRPLFEDMLQAENLLEVRGPLGRTETALAIQLGADRAQAWNASLTRLAEVWKLGQPAALKLQGAEGWQVKRAQAPNLLQFARAGQWVVVGLGQEPLSLAPALLQQIARDGRPAALPNATLLDVQADLPALGAWFPWLTQYGLAPMHLAVRGQGEHVRTEMQFRLPAPLRTPLEAWQFPTNLIGEPLTSFTVARGVAPLLNAVPGLAKAGLTPTPNQICVWGFSNEQCRVYASMPSPAPAAAVGRLALGLPELLHTKLDRVLGEFYYVSNRSYLAWGNVPFIQPYLQPTTNAGQKFLEAGIFPLPARQTPAPLDLFNQLGGRPNLVYYDWEITPQRLWNGRLLWDFFHILSRHLPQPDTSASKTWLTGLVNELWKDPSNPSQSVTEVTLASPTELRLVRKSHLGLTGFELASLSAWLDSPGFPLRYVPPQRLSSGRGTNAPGAKAGSPRPAAPKR